MAELRLEHMTPQQLLACCDAAHHAVLSDFSGDYTWMPPYSCAAPEDMQNDELTALSGLYSSMLTTPELRASTMELLQAKQEGAAALLYFLEIPRLVYSVRNDGTGRYKSTDEKFPLKSVLTKIQKDEELLRFCRETLDDDSAHNGKECDGHVI